MKFLIFLKWKPIITETFLLNEFDILKRNKIEFKIYFVYQLRKVKRQPKLKAYKNQFHYINQLPKLLWWKTVYILHYQLKLLFFSPFKYLTVLLWILLHYKRYLLRSYFRIAKYIPEMAAFNPDLVYCHYHFENAIFAYFANLFLNKKNYGMVIHQSNITNKILFSLDSCFGPDYIITKTRHTNDVLLKRFPSLDKKKLFTLPWGINVKYFKKHQCSRNKQFTILSIARLVEQKGIIHLLEACNILKINNIDFNCIIVGEGTDNGKLQKYIKDYNLNKYVKICSFLPHSPKYLRLYSSADLFILPCIIGDSGIGDMAPNALLEAMAMELPVITTKVTGMQEVAKDGESIIFTKEKDPKDLAEKIKMVMDMPKEKRREIGRRAREIVVTRFDKWKQGEKFVQFLRSQI